jgi:hypothetical protein
MQQMQAWTGCTGRSEIVIFKLKLHILKIIEGSPLEKFGDGKYEDLFVTALRNHGMLCIGLYRYKVYTHTGYCVSSAEHFQIP